MRFSLLLFVIAPITLLSQSLTPKQVELHDHWEFSSANGILKGKAEVPGNIHTDLLANKLIEDPYEGMNELDYQWIEDSTWIYTTTFDVSVQDLQFENIFLEFEGLDTYATIYLNGLEIGKSNNMFLAWQNEVKTWLQPGKNTLKVIFDSPYTIHENTAKKTGYQLPASNDAGENKVSPYVRKAPYHFGWDWAPKLTTCGVYMPVRLTFKNTIYIEDVHVYTASVSEEEAIIEYEVRLNQAPSKLNYSVQISDQEGVYFSEESPTDFKVIRGKCVIEQPKIWWPNGLGDQPLLDFTFSLGSEDVYEQKIGIRQARTHQIKDKTGKSFYFTVNGQKIFAKGANYIPQDVFINQKTDDDYEQLILQAKAANFNMLRVWGGGIYERDLFYELCDKHGILVWQDLMFACSMYPSDRAFLQNVREEVAFQVKRLRNHACLAHWNGNNEVNVAWGNWGWQSEYQLDDKTQKTIETNYQLLFEDVIPRTIYALDKRTYTHTSPLSNWGPQGDFDTGTMHYWGVWHNKEPLENYHTNVGRFMSEYGFQSFPSLALLQRYVPKDSLFLASESMKHRQKSYIGNEEILARILDYFPEPESFEAFVELSQLTQAIAYENAIEAHRFKRPHCMGTLYWQLNDCWPGPSWSTVDYSGELKAAHYKVAELYQNIIPILKIEKGTVTSFISNDTNVPISCEISLQLIDVKTGEILKSHKNETPVEPLTTSLSNKIGEFLRVKSKNTYIHVELRINDEVVSTRNIIPNWYLFARKNSIETIKRIYLGI